MSQKMVKEESIFWLIQILEKNANFILDGTLKYTRFPNKPNKLQLTSITHPNKFKKNTFSHITSSLPQTIARD